MSWSFQFSGSRFWAFDDTDGEHPKSFQYNTATGALGGSFPLGLQGILGHHVLIHSVGFDVTTSGVTANRRCQLQLIESVLQPERTLFVWPSSTVQTLSLSRRYHWSQGVSLATTLVSSTVKESLPPGLHLSPGDRLVLSIASAQAGDTMPLALVYGSLLQDS